MNELIVTLSVVEYDDEGEPYVVSRVLRLDVESSLTIDDVDKMLNDKRIVHSERLVAGESSRG